MTGCNIYLTSCSLFSCVWSGYFLSVCCFHGVTLQVVFLFSWWVRPDCFSHICYHSLDIFLLLSTTIYYGFQCIKMISLFSEWRKIPAINRTEESYSTHTYYCSSSSSCFHAFIDNVQRKCSGLCQVVIWVELLWWWQPIVELSQPVLKSIDWYNTQYTLASSKTQEDINEGDELEMHK